MFVSQNMAHFHVSGAGHEATAALAAHLTDHDWLHLHYRDKGLLLARGLSIQEFFSSLLGRSASQPAGRQMSAHFSSPKLKISSMVGPVGNNALQAVGIAAAIKDQPERSFLVCSVGDGTTQQGEFLEAIAEAVSWTLPVMFLVEDNHWSISTPTHQRTFRRPYKGERYTSGKRILVTPTIAGWTVWSVVPSELGSRSDAARVL